MEAPPPNPVVEEEDDEEIKQMQAQLLKMEEEANKVLEEGEQVESQGATTADDTTKGAGERSAGDDQQVAEEENDADKRQIFVGNLDNSVTLEELNDFFKSCGTVNRITILCDKFTGAPKGFAYMEFAEEEAVEVALGLNETEFKGKPIKVTRKRKNVPRHMLRGRGGYRGGQPYRGRGYRGRGGYRGARGQSRGRGRYQPY
mmetsp:Transcript_22449/g.39778  ORF Transcript_22449/g.39778 Transcript_22449/m.39778 type:complete len:202 (+) Transcript_22449:403-1008(+)